MIALPAALALPVFAGAALFALLINRWRAERGGWLALPPMLARGGVWLVRAGWLAALAVTLVLLYSWPAHPLPEAVDGPDRQQGTIRMYNVEEYLAGWRTYDNYGTMAEPLLLWLWGIWLAVSAGLRLVFGLTVRGGTGEY